MVDTATQTFDTDPVVGHFLTVTGELANFDGSPTLVPVAHDGVGNTYTLDKAEAANTFIKEYAISAPVAATTSSFTITMANTGSGTNWYNWTICEWAGTLTTPIDQTGSGAVSANTTLTLTAGGANSQASALVITIVGSSAVGTMGTPSGYTSFGMNTAFGVHGDYKIINASETSSAIFISSMTETYVEGLIVTYKGSTVTSSATPHYRLTNGAGH